MISAPARIGSHVCEVDTPALLVELDALERNIRGMQDRIAGTKLRLRPHAKTHKSTAIANLQLAAGAVGVCCQKVSEAEIMVDGGIGDVLISNEVVGAAKLDRAAALARRAKIAVCVDDSENVEQLAAAAEKFGAQIDVLIELDVGANRCGSGRRPKSCGWRRRSRDRDRCGLRGCRPTTDRPSTCARTRIAAGRSPAQPTRFPIRSTCCGGMDSNAGSSPAPAPALSSSRSQAASMTSCRSGPMCSWTRTMDGTRIATAGRSPNSRTRCSCSPPS